MGHQLALISVRSNVAGQALDRDAAAGSEAIAHVKSASRKALCETARHRQPVTTARRPRRPHRGPRQGWTASMNSLPRCAPPAWASASASTARRYPWHPRSISPRTA
ncbi:hypothetical protein [Streptomyces sp. NPDC059863]|uniref:hypothetical protein n=1 Tax=unclassified Streptomyces TaxID=2593676 RepID=UPI00365BCCD8